VPTLNFPGFFDRFAGANLVSLTEEAANSNTTLATQKDDPRLARILLYASGKRGTSREEGTVEAKRSDGERSYALNEYDAKGNLVKAICMSRDQYRDVKKTLLDQGCEIVDEAAQTTAAGKG
jgi:hypothetical protein